MYLKRTVEDYIYKVSLHKLPPVRIIDRSRNDNGKWCYIFPTIDIFPVDFVIAFFSFTVVIQMIPLLNHILKIRNTSCRIFHSLQSNGFYIPFQKSSVRMLILQKVKRFLLFCMVHLYVIPALYIKYSEFIRSLLFQEI